MAAADGTADGTPRDDRYYFLVRRLHSLSGLVPVGVFLCVHLSVNASIIAGPKAFQFAIDQIHMLDKLGILRVVEVLFILLPLAFHSLVGIVIWLSGRPNVMAYPYGGNIRYALQRWTGVIALLFILVHLWHVHWIIPGGVEFDPHAATETTVRAFQASWAAPVYAVGVVCSVFHLVNGIWTFLITWGITIGPKAQRLSGYVCVMLGVVLGLFGLGAIWAIKTTDAATLSPPSVTSPADGATDDTGPRVAAAPRGGR